MSDGERQLKPANENPWYVLMTLFGEQDGDEIDWDLHEKNMEVWNAWACQDMEAARRRELADKLELDYAKLTGWEGRRPKGAG